MYDPMFKNTYVCLHALNMVNFTQLNKNNWFSLEMKEITEMYEEGLFEIVFCLISIMHESSIHEYALNAIGL